jgi:hypothetical protein
MTGLQNYRENFSAIKIKEIDADGRSCSCYKRVPLWELEKDPTLGGLTSDLE